MTSPIVFVRIQRAQLHLPTGRGAQSFTSRGRRYLSVTALRFIRKCPIEGRKCPHQPSESCPQWATQAYRTCPQRKHNCRHFSLRLTVCDMFSLLNNATARTLISMNQELFFLSSLSLPGWAGSIYLFSQFTAGKIRVTGTSAAREIPFDKGRYILVHSFCPLPTNISWCDQIFHYADEHFMVWMNIS